MYGMQNTEGGVSVCPANPLGMRVEGKGEQVVRGTGQLGSASAAASHFANVTQNHGAMQIVQS